MILIKQKSCHATKHYHQNGVDLVFSCADKGDDENEATDSKRIGVFGGGAEIFYIHQHQGCGGKQADNGRTQTAENGFNRRMLLVFQKKLADGEH